MTYKKTVRVTRELLEHSPINDEHLFRELARAMVEDMPIEYLSKLIEFTKTDPRTREAIAKIEDPETPQHERDFLLSLQMNRLISYEAKVSV